MENSLQQKKYTLRSLARELQGCASPEERVAVLQTAVSYTGVVTDLLPNLPLESQVVLLSVIAIGQAERILVPSSPEALAEELDLLLAQLIPVERFYSSMGGIVGYQCRMMELLAQEGDDREASCVYHPAEGIDISTENATVYRAIWEGIVHLDRMGEIYPVGGAADRLRLQDEKTGTALPAARLPFLGKTLLEGMIADLQSREYLCFKVTGKQVVVPVAMMTSMEKENHRHIVSICEEAGWFGRACETFRFFCQPLVPTVNRSGEWCLLRPMHLFLKPGGHGAIWRLAREEGIFDWFFSLGRDKVLVRQINNPVANTDYGLFAFTGIGCAQDKMFGFASCPRQVKASEGINVITERAVAEGFEYALTNIEYCDFKRFGIVDEPEYPGSPYSKFSSNTNILLADLRAILSALEKCPIPGILVNLKKTTYQKREEEVTRLESTMQNIADFFTENHREPIPEGKRGRLQTYLTYNERRKTISAAKREFALGASLLETPEGCLLDILQNGREALLRCGLDVPVMNDAASFFTQGPALVFLYHPALGPLYSILAQKIRGGKIAWGSELQLQIAELDMENLELEGTLLIDAEAVMGHLDSDGRLIYSERCGKCTLKNVTVRNRGIDREMPNVYWKNEIARQESCHIILRGHSEFYAEDVVLQGDQFIEVEDGYRTRAVQEGEEVRLITEPLTDSGWSWKASVDADYKIIFRRRA